VLVDRGEMTLDQASMQSIRQWVADNPDKADDVLNQNASYVFFEEQQVSGAIGAQSVVLTAGRSLAIDRAKMPLGAPFWLEIDQSPEDQERQIRRLMVAQDTGGAIVGAVRGDFFWGEGDEAGQIAGRMKDRGRYFIFLPKTIAARLPDPADL
jgi:membrane-bound lytic murein transglycosylase A